MCMPLHRLYTLECQAPLMLVSPVSRMQTLRTAINWKYSGMPLLKFWGGWWVGGAGCHWYNMVAKRTKLSWQMETFGTGHLWIKKQKPKMTNVTVYDCLRWVGRTLERQIPHFPWHWFVLIWEHTSGFLQYFPLTEGNVWNTARYKTTVKYIAKPWSIEFISCLF